MTAEKWGGMGPRRPRIDVSDARHGSQDRYERLHAEIESLLRHIAKIERRVAVLEAEQERRKRILRTCSMCGRVTTRPEPDDRCPYCQNGRLRRI